MSQGKVPSKKPTDAKLHIQFPVLYRTRGFINIFTTAWLTPSQLIF